MLSKQQPNSGDKLAKTSKLKNKIIGIFILFSCSASFSFGNQCRDFYSLYRVHDLDTIFSKKYETHPQGNLKFSVFFDRFTEDGYIVLRKHPSDPWFSNQAARPNSYTKQGDPLNIIKLLGPEIADLFGFRLYTRSDGFIELWVPGSKMLAETFSRMNEVLADPIGFLPVAAEFEKSLGFLKKASEKQGRFLMKFPLAQHHKQLTVHDVSYHLGAMLYPLSVLSKASLINQKTLELFHTLSNITENSEFKTIAKHLIRDRALEMDLGTADPQALLSDARFQYGRLQMFESIEWVPENRLKAERAFSYLFHPGFKPTEIVLLRLLRISSMDAEYSSLLAGRKPPRFIETEPGFNIQLAVTNETKLFINATIIPGLISDVALEPANTDKSAEDTVYDLVDTLDIRLRQLREALVKVQKSQRTLL